MEREKKVTKWLYFKMRLPLLQNRLLSTEWLLKSFNNNPMEQILSSNLFLWLRYAPNGHQNPIFQAKNAKPICYFWPYYWYLPITRD